MPVYPVKHVSWGEVVEWTSRLADRIEASGFRADAVVAVGRGGYVVSRILCDLLGVEKLVSLPIRWSSGGPGESYLEDLVRCFRRFGGPEAGGCVGDVVRRLRLETPVRVSADLRGMRALAVEEISATGVQLARAREVVVGEWGAAEARTAALVWKASTSSLRPDYTFIETRSFVWFQFPWSRLSDYRAFARVAISESCSPGSRLTLRDVVELFREWYGFEPEERYLRRALRRLAGEGFLVEEPGGAYRVP